MKNNNKKSSNTIVQRLRVAGMLGAEAEENISTKKTDNLESAANTQKNNERKKPETTGKKSKKYEEKTHDINVIDADIPVKKDYENFFVKQEGNQEAKMTTVSIRKDKHYQLQLITSLENKGGIADLIDNIINDFIEKYKKDIEKSVKRFRVPL